MLKMLRPDSKGRISLGALTKGISGFSVHQKKDGKIVLEPFVEIPAHEKWLFENKAVLNQVKTGLKQAKEGQLIDKGRFSEFTEDE
ncbi:MAG: hypothetical protein QNK11_01685 [Legionella sp.]|nr:hypothetical protein [Legionella sp.]